MKVVGVYDSFFSSYQREMETLCDRYIISFRELLH